MAIKGISFSNSGLDVEQMVKMSMKPYQSRYDSMFRKKELLSWKKESYNTILKAFDDYKKSLSDFKLSKTLSKRTVSSTNADAVTASTESGSAMQMTHTVSVSNLAKSAVLRTANGKQVSNILNPDGTSSGTKSTKLHELAGLNDAAVQAKIDAGQGKDVALSFDIADGDSVSTVSYTYDDLKGGKTLNDFAADIKGLNLNITASYDAANDSFSITNKNTGAKNKIQIDVNTPGSNAESEVNGNKLLTQLQMGQYDGENPIDNVVGYNSSDSVADNQRNYLEMLAGTDPAKQIKGQDAEVTIDGKNYTSGKNDIIVDGINYKFLNVTTGGDPAKISVTQDTKAIVESVQKFVDSYNELLAKINLETRTDRPKANKKVFDPLTDEEKKEMSEDQIKEWEKKGKTGLLYGDSMLSDITSSMRSMLSAPIAGLSNKHVITIDNKDRVVDYNSAASIGLEVKGGWTEYGKLTLDAEKLEQALQQDPEAAYKIFGTMSSDGTESQGLAHRLDSVMKKAMEDVGAQAKDKQDMGSHIGEDGYLFSKISTMESSLESMLKMMSTKEQNFYNKFNAMEQAVGNLQNSLNALSGIMG